MATVDVRSHRPPRAPARRGAGRPAAHRPPRPAATVSAARPARAHRGGGGRRRRLDRLRDACVALLALGAAVGAVVLVLHEDPASRAALVDLLGPVLDDVRAQLARAGIDVG